jgi:nitrogen regulatory protein PII
MTQSIALKVVTIIAPAEYRERVERDLRELGASGYTLCEVSGSGQHEPRRHGLLSTGNVRIESLVTSAVAARLLAHVAEQANLRILAFAHDVEAVPVERFTSRSSLPPSSRQ